MRSRLRLKTIASGLGADVGEDEDVQSLLNYDVVNFSAACALVPPALRVCATVSLNFLPSHLQSCITAFPTQFHRQPAVCVISLWYSLLFPLTPLPHAPGDPSISRPPSLSTQIQTRRSRLKQLSLLNLFRRGVNVGALDGTWLSPS